MSYPNVLFGAELESLETRRNNISRSFFQGIWKPNSCLYHLIPPACDTSVTTRLRRTTPFPRPVLRTKNTVHLPINSDSQLFHFTHTSHSTCTYAYCLFCFVCYCCFYLLFLLYLTIRPSGRKDANKLID